MPKGILERRHDFSLGELLDYERCPRYYRLKNVDKAVCPPTFNDIEDECHRRATMAALSEQLDRRQHIDLFFGLFHQNVHLAAQWGKRNIIAAERAAEMCITDFHLFRPQLPKMACNVENEVKLGVNIVHVVHDASCESCVIRFKTLPSGWSRNERIDYGCSVLSAAAVGKRMYLLEFYTAKETATMRKMRVTRTVRMLGRQQTEDYAEAINMLSFPRARMSDTVCTPSGCKYYEICRRKLNSEADVRIADGRRREINARYQ